MSEDRLPYNARPRSAAEEIRNLLRASGLSPDDASRELGIDELTLTEWCTGKVAPPRMANLALERLVQLRQAMKSLK